MPLVGRLRSCILAVAIIAPAGIAVAQPAPGIPLSENFDSVTAPALPYGWIASNAQGPDPKWVTDTSTSDTPPNAAHVDDPAAVADKRLDSPPFFIFTPSAQLIFRQYFNFAYYAQDCDPVPCQYFLDGGVLEISINGGAFEDIVSAGGSIPQFGYGGPITTGTSNPLSGRPGWVSYSGSSFVTTVVNLPPAAAGTTVVLRWRMGSAQGNICPLCGWWIDSVEICDGFPCDAAPYPEGLEVDTGGNGVLEPGETVDLDTYYFNNTSGSIDLTGLVGNLSGPPGTQFTVIDSAATFGTIPPGALGSCAFTPDCYSVSLADPGTRPAQHWDTQFVEDLSNGLIVDWVLHVGGSFSDVLTSNPFYSYIETIFHNGVTSGCGVGQYCPDTSTTRAQMAVFLLKAKHASSYVPPACIGIFGDVPCPSQFANWIEELYTEGITGGCGASPLNYCPNEAVTRAQMAVFLLKAKHGSGYVSPTCAGIFTDVTCPSTFANWIEELYDEGITGGCGTDPPIYCPGSAVTRGQMAVFLKKTFGLSLYGP